MRHILFILFFYFSSTFASGQKFAHITAIQKKADSLVVSFWGQKNFDKYIHLDKKRSEYLVFGPRLWEKVCRLNSKLSFQPNTYLYKYKVIHPLFRGDTAIIKFYLDSLGNFMTGLDPTGFFQGGYLDTLTSITKTQAIQKAKEFGLEQGQGKWTISISWKLTDPHTLNLNENSTIREYIQGHYTWDVEATLGESYYDGCIFYSKRIYSIDIFSGALIMKRDM